MGWNHQLVPDWYHLFHHRPKENKNTSTNLCIAKTAAFCCCFASLWCYMDLLFTTIQAAVDSVVYQDPAFIAADGRHMTIWSRHCVHKHSLKREVRRGGSDEATGTASVSLETWTWVRLCHQVRTCCNTHADGSSQPERLFSGLRTTLVSEFRLGLHQV